MSDKMREGTENYAKADKSDPFALARALCHINNGIAQPYNRAGEEAFYNTTPIQETRIAADGSEYHVTVYHNMIRP